jgi:RNA polymerase sigma-70 factor (ECF subfamily)
MDQTSQSLLVRIRQGNSAADWNRFVELYTPVLVAWARHAGLRPEEALDLVQDVMLTLLQKLPEFEYDPQRRFRSWLKTLLMNKWRDRLRRLAAAPAAGAAGLSDVPQAADAGEAFWEHEHRQLLVRRALEIMQTDFADATWRACWLTVVEGRSASEAARELEITENAVYIARHRVLQRLREELAELLDE